MSNSHKTNKPKVSVLKAIHSELEIITLSEFDIVISSSIYLNILFLLREWNHLTCWENNKGKKKRSRKQHLFNYSMKRAFSPPKEMKTRWSKLRNGGILLLCSKLIINMVMIFIKYLLCSQRTQLCFGLQQYFTLLTAFWMKYSE